MLISTLHSAEVRFASFPSGGFINAIKPTGKETSKMHLCALSVLFEFSPINEHRNSEKSFILKKGAHKERLIFGKTENKNSK